MWNNTRGGCLFTSCTREKNGIFGIILDVDVKRTSFARVNWYLRDSDMGHSRLGELLAHLRRGIAVGCEVVDDLGTHAAESGPPIASYMEDKTAVNPESNLLGQAKLFTGRYVQILGTPVGDSAHCCNVTSDRSGGDQLRNPPPKKTRIVSEY